MLFLRTLLLFALLLAPALAAPARQLTKGRSFKVGRVHRADFVPSGPAALNRAHQRYGVESLQTRTSGLSNTDRSLSHIKRANGTVITKVDAIAKTYDSEFLSPVMIGNQTLMLNFDTGSADFWVFNTQISPTSIGNHTAFNPFKSSTFKIIPGAKFHISYGDSSKESGNVGRDTVSIGSVAFPEQIIGLATHVTQSFINDIDKDGLVGLAFSKMNTVKPKPQMSFFQSILPTLAQPVFTANLRDNANNSAYEFGKIDTAKFKGDLTYVPVNSSSGWWQVLSNRFFVADKIINVRGGPAIADTGTSLILLDEAVVTAYYAEVSGAKLESRAGGYVFPCESNLPDLSIGIGDTYTAVVPGDSMRYAPSGNLYARSLFVSHWWALQDRGGNEQM